MIDVSNRAKRDDERDKRIDRLLTVMADFTKTERLAAAKEYISGSFPTRLTFNFRPPSTPEEQKKQHDVYVDMATQIGGTYMGCTRVCDGCNMELLFVVGVPRCEECKGTYDLCKECRDAGLSLKECPRGYGCKSPDKDKSLIDSFCDKVADNFGISREELRELIDEVHEGRKK